MNKQKGSIFAILLGFVTLAVIIGMIIVATNTLKQKQDNQKLKNQTNLEIKKEP